MLIVVLQCFRKILGGFAELWSNQLNVSWGILFYPVTLCCMFTFYFLLEKQNQSIRGNGRKQYQDSPNPKKKPNGVHSQPAKQQNPLVVRVNIMLRQFMLFRMRQGHCQGILNCFIDRIFMNLCVCAVHH